MLRARYLMLLSIFTVLLLFFSKNSNRKSLSANPSSSVFAEARPQGEDEGLTCPIKVAFRFQTRHILWASHRISTVSWPAALRAVGADVSDSGSNLSSVDDSTHVLFLLARDPLFTAANLRSLRKRHPKLVLGAARAYALDQCYIPLIDFGVLDNRFMSEQFVASGADALRLPSIDFLSPENQAAIQPSFKGQFSVQRPAIVCYHGNTMHLMSMRDDVIPALNRLSSSSVPIVLRIIYDPPAGGIVSSFAMKYIRVNRTELIPYNHSTIHARLQGCDLGLVPQSDDSGDEYAARTDAMKNNTCYALKHSARWFGDSVLLSKRSSNAGRAFLFSMLGVPVVADATPHLIENVQGHELGVVLESRPAWEPYLLQVLTDAELRQRYHENALQFSRSFLTPRALGLTMADFFVTSYGDRLPDEVVKKCRTMLMRAQEKGEVFERIRNPKPSRRPLPNCPPA